MTARAPNLGGTKVALAHEAAQTGGTQNSGNQNGQEQYRNRGSQSHFENSTLPHAPRANLNPLLLLLNPFSLQNHLLMDIKSFALNEGQDLGCSPLGRPMEI